MRRSRHIALVLIGSAALQGCESEPDFPLRAQRDLYASREDCIADWGRRENCEEDHGTGTTPSGGGSYGGGRYTGPVYNADDRSSAQAEARNQARVAGNAGVSDATGPAGDHSVGRLGISRGGFGSGAHVFGARGG